MATDDAGDVTKDVGLGIGLIEFCGLDGAVSPMSTRFRLGTIFTRLALAHDCALFGRRVLSIHFTPKKRSHQTHIRVELCASNCYFLLIGNTRGHRCDDCYRLPRIGDRQLVLV